MKKDNFIKITNISNMTFYIPRDYIHSEYDKNNQIIDKKSSIYKFKPAGVLNFYKDAFNKVSGFRHYLSEGRWSKDKFSKYDIKEVEKKADKRELKNHKAIELRRSDNKNGIAVKENDIAGSVSKDIKFNQQKELSELLVE